jgi:hypothetical protein
MCESNRRGKLDEAALTAAERALLEYVELITLAAYRSTTEDGEKLRVAGWREEPISKAGIHHNLVRVADPLASAIAPRARV